MKCLPIRNREIHRLKVGPGDFSSADLVLVASIRNESNENYSAERVTLRSAQYRRGLMDSICDATLSLVRKKRYSARFVTLPFLVTFPYKDFLRTPMNQYPTYISGSTLVLQHFNYYIP